MGNEVYDNEDETNKNEMLIDMKYFEPSSKSSSTSKCYSKVSSQQILTSKNRLQYQQQEYNRRINSSATHMKHSEASINEESGESESFLHETQIKRKKNGANRKLKGYLRSLDLVNSSRNLLPKRARKLASASGREPFKLNLQDKRQFFNPVKIEELSHLSNRQLHRNQSDLSLISQNRREQKAKNLEIDFKKEYSPLISQTLIKRSPITTPAID